MLKKILVIDDDPEMNELLALKFKDFYDLEITYGHSYVEAMATISANTYDLFIIDYRLDNNRTGFEVLEVLKTKMNISNRVIMISAVQSEELMIKSYDLGVSNFMIKPLKLNLFGAIFKKNLRMLSEKIQKVIQLNQMRIELALQTCYELIDNSENEIPLTSTEFKILARIMSTPEQIVSKNELVFLGSDPQDPMSYKSLEMHIGNMRKKSDVISRALHTKRGIGYYWKLRSDELLNA